MKFFDSNCCLGRLSVPMPGHIDTAKELSDLMERAGVDEALVYHAFSKEYSPAVGNRRILEEINEHDNLHPCWTLLPHHTGEMPPAEDLVAEMTSLGVRAARIFPKTHNWTLAQWSAGGLLKPWRELPSRCLSTSTRPIGIRPIPFRVNTRTWLSC